jgi:NADH dehydrogenase FAD-containing subunit
VLGAPPGSLLALGDASLCLGPDGPLPQTAQVAAQQGAYAARLLNRRYDLSADGAPTNRQAAQGDAQAWLRLRGAVDARPFDFLNLGLLAYLGGGEAISQVQVGERRLLSEAPRRGRLASCSGARCMSSSRCRRARASSSSSIGSRPKSSAGT